MKPHKFIKAVAAMLLFLALIGAVNAIGISPAKKVVNFAPETEETLTFNIVNNEKKDLSVLIEITGPLEQYTEIEEKIIKINNNEASKQFEIKLKLPRTFEKPGLHESKISIREVPNTRSNAMQIFTAPLIKAKLQVKVPYPGKYIESMLVVEKYNKNVRFVMPVFNYGSEDLNSVKAFVRIFDNQNNLIRELETESTSIDSSSQSKLNAAWHTNEMGSYYVIANIDYDGKGLELKDSFDIGVPFINTTKIIVDNFKLGDIAKFDIYLKSGWNDKLNVYAGAIIFREDKVYLSSKTEPIDLFVGKEDIVNLFWETEDIEEGGYDLNLTIKYDLGESNHIVKLMVNENSIITSLTPERIIAGKDIIKYLIIAIVVLIITSWLIYFRKFRKR